VPGAGWPVGEPDGVDLTLDEGAADVFAGVPWWPKIAPIMFPKMLIVLSLI
jgi:hypothetical protein